MEGNEYGLQSDLDGFIRQLQVSVHDQIGALRDDVHRAVADSGAALELSAMLENRAQEVLQTPERVERSLELLVSAVHMVQEEGRKVALEVARTRMLTGINQVCSRLLCLAMVGSICSPGGQDRRDSSLQQITDVLGFWKDSSEQAAAMEKMEEMDPLANQLANRYLTLQARLIQI